MKKIVLLVSILLLLIVAGCGGDFEKLNASDRGILIEQLLPQDSWLVLSITTRDAEQRELFNDFVSQFSDGEDFWARVEAGFADMGMNYEEDVAPILGDEGFRLVMAYTDGGSFVGMTVADVEKAQNWLDSTVERGEAEILALGEADMYVTSSNGEESYSMLVDDILLVAGDSVSLVNAKGQLDANGAESLLDNKQYMDDVAEVQKPYVGYVYVDFDGYKEIAGADFGFGSILGMGSFLMDAQVWALAFNDDGAVLSGYGDGDRELIDDLGLSLFDLEGDGVYLAEKVPGEDLVFYDESGSIKSFLNLWILKNGSDIETTYESINQATTGYFGLDFEEQILGFLDKGYAVAIHNNGSAVLPGISLVIDVSDDVENASEFVTMLDTQLSSLVLMMQYDETGAWESLSKADSQMLGGDFHVISIPMSALGETVSAYVGETGGEFLTLLYGITEDDLLVISTYDMWDLFNGENSVADMVDFDELEGHDDTVFYLDLKVLADYLYLLEADTAESVLMEDVPSPVGFESYLSMLDDFVFGIKAGRYDVWMRGLIK